MKYLRRLINKAIFMSQGNIDLKKLILQNEIYNKTVKRHSVTAVCHAHICFLFSIKFVP